jgi:predicted NAD-dependent protein-ADP-ribosyltransferase YbiA (DUF1768 family)
MDYLSNDSYFPFEIDGVVYPTVTHFIKEKSKGIQTQQLSLFQLRLKSKTRFQTDAIECKKSTRKNAFLEQAVVEKFQQNPELLEQLDSTGNSIIKFDDNADLGFLLMKIRDKHRNSIKYKDVSFSELTFEEYNILKEIVRLAKKIQFEEKQNKLFEGMIEDSVYNILDDYYQDSFMDETDKINIYYSSLPNFRQLVQNIERQMGLTGRISITLGLFIKFYRENSPTLKMKIDTIIYPCKKRDYRKSFKQ